MSLQEDRDSRRRRKPESDPDPAKSPTDSDRSARKRPPRGEVGNALRSAYQRMMDEDIPPEMLDLLGKLG